MSLWLISPSTDIVHCLSKYLVVGSSSVFLLRAEEVDEEDEPISEMVNLVHQPQVFLKSIYSIEGPRHFGTDPDPHLWLKDPDPTPNAAIFLNDLQDGN